MQDWHKVNSTNIHGCQHSKQISCHVEVTVKVLFHSHRGVSQYFCGNEASDGLTVHLPDDRGLNMGHWWNCIERES